MHLPRVWAEIDLGQLKRNLAACRSFLPSSCSVLGVVKADAYGHGAIPIARTLEAASIGMLGVGDSHEAIRLREAGIRAPILVLGAVVDGEIPEMIHHGITPTLHSPERILSFQKIARSMDRKLPVHLLVDTGMHRLGVTARHALGHVQSVLEAPELELQGIGTHLSSVLEDPEYTREQIRIFEQLIQDAQDSGIQLPRLHAVSSTGLTLYPRVHLDMVRLGGGLFGIGHASLPAGIQPILSLYSQIVYLRDVPEGTAVSYGCTFRTKRPSRIATLPVGYYDGYMHALSNRSEVLIRGRRAPVVGRVTMDYIMIDVTDIPGARVGDHTTLIGVDGQHKITAAELAAHAGTIPYEITCHLGNRIRRFHDDAPGRASQEGTLPEDSIPEAVARRGLSLNQLP